MKIYVSGPISGYVNANVDAFRAAADRVRALGHEPVVPHDVPAVAHRGVCPRGYAMPMTGDEHTSNACYLRGDFQALLGCEGIYLLRDWERSVGARAEFELAAISGLDVYYERAPMIEKA